MRVNFILGVAMVVSAALCHGPDADAIAGARRVVELERALTDPSADIRTGNRTATVVRRDGSTVIGRLLNQDTYSLQLIDARAGGRSGVR
jgi:hypothetical protein